MGLLAPWFLAAAAAVGLPIYLHLLRRRATTPQPFSSLMFFEPRTQSSIRHRRLRYLLLLSLRMALLVLLALAFANPFIRRPAARAPSGTLLLLVIDDSFSMRAGTRMSDAQREARAVLASRRSSAPVQVMALDAQLHQLTPQTRDSATLRAAIDAVQAGDSRSSFGELARAVRLVSDEAHASIELHFVSDMQRSSTAATFSEMALPSTVALVLHPVASAATPNWTVESVTAPGQLWGPAKDARAAHVQAVIAGYATPAATRTASLVVNGKTIASKEVQLAANGRATVEFSSLDVPYGFSRCEVRIDSGDAFPNDDGYLFAVQRSDPQNVLFLHAATDARSLRYFGDALHSAAESAFVLQSASVEQAPALSLSKYGFIVLSNLFGLPAPLEASLRAYVKGGGSVLIALGTSASRGRVPIFDQSIRSVHDYARGFSRGREPFVSVGDTDRSHASVGRTGSLSGVKFFYAVDVDPGDAQVVARLTDGTPLLLDKKVGEGRVMLLTSGLENLTNDFPLHPAFVAFVEQTARYLAGAERPASARIVDSLFDLRTAREPEGGAQRLGVEVVDPDGHRPLSLTEAATTQALRLARAGFYQIRLANGREDIVGVNPDRRESNLDVLPQDVQALWRGSPAPVEPTAVLAAGNAPPEYEPVGVWWYIMLITLVAALSESWLASRYLGTRREDT